MGAVQQSNLASALPSPPAFTNVLNSDLDAAKRYLTSIKGSPRDLKEQTRSVKESFFRHHAVAMYDALTERRSKPLRVSELVYAAAERYPGLLPTRKQIDDERALKRQGAKQGLEIDQGMFVAHVLADETCGTHLVHSMLRPRREAEKALPDFLRTGFADLGAATVERKDNVGHVTLTNPAFLNA